MAQSIDKITKSGAREMVPGTGDIDQAVRRRITKRVTAKPSRAPATLDAAMGALLSVPWLRDEPQAQTLPNQA